MITVTCQCGKAIQVSDEAAGKTGRCKACGATLTIPLPMGPLSRPSPPPPPMSALSTPSEFIELQSEADWSRPRPKSPYAATLSLPWYHHALRVLAYLVMIAGLLPFVFYVVGSIQDQSTYRPSPSAVLSGLLIMLLWVVVGFVIGCSLLVLTDISKAIRSRSDT